MEKVIELLNTIVCGMVDFPEDVKIDPIDEVDEKGEVTVLKVRVNSSDVGRCIGAKGNFAEALRLIIGNIGYRSAARRVYVTISSRAYLIK